MTASTTISSAWQAAKSPRATPTRRAVDKQVVEEVGGFCNVVAATDTQNRAWCWAEGGAGGSGNEVDGWPVSRSSRAG